MSIHAIPAAKTRFGEALYLRPDPKQTSNYNDRATHWATVQNRRPAAPNFELFPVAMPDEKIPNQQFIHYVALSSKAEGAITDPNRIPPALKTYKDMLAATIKAANDAATAQLGQFAKAIFPGNTPAQQRLVESSLASLELALPDAIHQSILSHVAEAAKAEAAKRGPAEKQYRDIVTV